MGVIKIDFANVALHPALVITFRNQGSMRVVDLHIPGPSIRTSETFSVLVGSEGRIWLSKTYTRMSLLDFLRAFQIPFEII